MMNFKKIDRKIDTISGKLQEIEDRTTTMQALLKELSDTSKKYFKSSFAIKGSSYEVNKFRKCRPRYKL